MQCAILAGGFGTRLGELTQTCPKPMMKIKGIPFLEYQIRLLKEVGYQNILVLTGYFSSVIEDYFKDGKSFGVNITYSIEKNPLGTGGALKNAEYLLEEKFLVLNGDTYLKLDYKKIITTFEERKKKALVVLSRNQNMKENYNIDMNEDGLIVKYDKTNSKGMKYIDSGVYIFQKSILDFLEEGKTVSLEMEAFPALIKSKEITGIETDKEFFDIGTVERLELFRERM